MTSVMHYPPADLLAGLQQHDVWSNAGLEPVTLEHGIQLWLLAIQQGRLFNSQEVAALWRYMPYWAFAWAGGRAMSSYLARHPQLVAGKRVLDVGCGSGIAAIQAERQGASRVAVCDIDPLATLAAQHNARLNGVVLDSVNEHDWDGFDLYLAGDLLYDPSSHGLLNRLNDCIPAGLTAEPVNAWQAISDSQSANAMLAATACPASAALDRGHFATLPAIGDFDQQVLIEIHAMPVAP
ncbi:methyltransferase [Oceanobacter sp. 4_MG-2023]|uniref:class I SAM-dependent methyltransferase n=1 Tax=Oceanobacter sp. 4_MG-2023 TaxID=3062623 RepID=UPI0027373C77|nr:50S ribosomal protein L11 methyltransferase [Oceanobacter sp. 4_MG-2023]MDP2549034.1 50S ribosomal protein L11 methyltransferase [Oceanobacter sp. 4_MG-2023]